MKRWQAYEEHLLTGDWQVHTTWSDGMNSIMEYCEEGRKQGLELIAFTEHVRRTLKYDFGEYITTIEAARERYPDLVILAGCEAKVLNVRGDLDAPPEVLDTSDLVLGAFHSFSPTQDYFEALQAMLRNSLVDVWAHPLLYARKHNVPMQATQIEQLVRLCREEQVLIEFNGKYNVPDLAIREMVITLGAPFVYGSDAHSVTELGRRPTSEATAPKARQKDRPPVTHIES